MTTILVIDDSDLVNNLLYETLTSHGYEALQAHNATQGHALAQQKHPDLIVLDIVLPDISGLELCRTLRGDPMTRHVPIMLVTGTATNTPDKVKGFQTGADDYMTKPLDLDEFIERVRALLRRTERQRNTISVKAEAPKSPDVQGEVSAPSLASHVKSLPATLSGAVFSPETLPVSLPSISLFFLVAMTLLLNLGLMAASGPAMKPFLVSLIGIGVWGLLVSVLVVSASIAGLHMKWKEGAQLLSLAALPILLKLGFAVLFSAWTTLSPFLFSASPALFITRYVPWISRLDAFEIWSALLVGILLRKRPGTTPQSVWGVAFFVWAVGALVAGFLQS